MHGEHDPQGTEVQTILGAADFADARVLEVGSGNGRLTFRYARACRFVVGIELKMEELVDAVKACPLDLKGRLAFAQASITRSPFSNETFDVVLFASSL